MIKNIKKQKQLVKKSNLNNKQIKVYLKYY